MFVKRFKIDQRLGVCHSLQVIYGLKEAQVLAYWLVVPFVLNFKQFDIPFFLHCSIFMY